MSPCPFKKGKHRQECRCHTSFTSSAPCQNWRFHFLVTLYDGLNVEDVIGPRPNIEIEPVRGQILSVAVVDNRTHLVVQAPVFFIQIRPWQRHIALAVVLGIVHDDQSTLAVSSAPGKGNECVPAGVAIPRRMTIQKPPVTFAKDRFLQPGKQQRVELLDLLVHRFLGTAAEMHRDLDLLPLKLAFMEKTKPWR